MAVLAIGVNVACLSKAYVAYSAYHEQFIKRAKIIESQKAIGTSPVIMPRYTIDFDSLEKYVHRERCAPEPISAIARKRCTSAFRHLRWIVRDNELMGVSRSENAINGRGYLRHTPPWRDVDHGKLIYAEQGKSICAF